MVTFWRRTTILQRIAWAILIVALPVGIGSFVWHYPYWPVSVAVIVSLILNSVGRKSGAGWTSGARNAQENDPNKR